MTTNKLSIPVPAFENAIGDIDYPFTNDFMFHVVLEENKSVLRKLLCSLLHMHPEEIKSVEIQNPIDYGRSITDKKVILDLKLLLNNSKIVDIEMQVINKGDWPERSVIYLCRSYDNVLGGEEYDSVNPAHQISILDFDLFDEEPEFYSTHHLRNDRTGRIYTSNFTLSVLNLRRVDLATDEDKKWKIDKWATLFKAKTWEDLRMIAAQDEEMTIASKALYKKNQDKYARIWAQAHEDFLAEERMLVNRVKDAESKAEQAESKAKQAESKVEYLRALLIANNIDPDSTL